ncbi:MAG: hypothetical protein ACLTZB_04040 [Streptococcus salivarius]
MLSVFPVSENHNMLLRLRFEIMRLSGELNQQLAVLPGVTYVDLYDYLTDAQGQLNDTTQRIVYT